MHGTEGVFLGVNARGKDPPHPISNFKAFILLLGSPVVLVVGKVNLLCVFRTSFHGCLPEIVHWRTVTRLTVHISGRNCSSLIRIVSIDLDRAAFPHSDNRSQVTVRVPLLTARYD